MLPVLRRLLGHGMFRPCVCALGRSLSIMAWAAPFARRCKEKKVSFEYFKQRAVRQSEKKGFRMLACS